MDDVRGRRLQGTTLGTVILVTSIGLLLVFTTAGVGLFQLSFATGLEQRQQARNLAESALAYGIARVMDDEQYGKARAAGQTVLLPGPDAKSYGVLSFHIDTAHTNGTLYSTNNLDVGGGVSGDGRTVPKQTAHLVGFGKVGEQVYEAEVILYRPPFPKTLAASGPIKSLGALLVAGVRDAQDYPGTMGGVPEDKRLPGHLASNSDADPAVHLSSAADITGDVQAVGTVLLDAGARVGGEVRPNSEPQGLPDLDIASLIDRTAKVTKDPPLPSTVGPLTVDWFTGTMGDLTVGGDLNLKNGVLFVGQNLTVQGKVTGEGAIFVGGETRIEHGAELSSESVVALARQRSVTLIGEERSSYYFQGLVYSEGDCSASNITVLGAMIANAPAGEGRLDLENVNLIQSPVSVQQNYVLPRNIATGYDGNYSSLLLQPVYQGGERRFFVRFIAFKPFPNVKFDRSFPAQPWTDPSSGLSYDDVYKLLDQKKGAFTDATHNNAVMDEGRAHLAALKDETPNEYVLDIDINSLLSELDRPRVMMWRRLR